MYVTLSLFYYSSWGEIDQRVKSLNFSQLKTIISSIYQNYKTKYKLVLNNFRASLTLGHVGN